jgi:Raf kinase inhibitor-like YbhB/YbcL family protein
MRLILARYLIILGLDITLFLALQAISLANPSSSFSLISSAFRDGDTIPESYTCTGVNKSPPVLWKGVPNGVRSLALIVSDPDAPRGTFVHWVIYNIDPASRGLPATVSTSTSLANAEQGVNGRSELGYTGPCPPVGPPHHYHFRLYALDQKLKLKPGATAQQLEAAMKGHLIGTAELVGIFQR